MVVPSSSYEQFFQSTARPHMVSKQGVEHLIVSSSRTIRPCTLWELNYLDSGGPYDQWPFYLCHTHKPSKGPYLMCKQYWKRLTLMQRGLSQTHTVLGYSRWVGVVIGDENMESLIVLQTLRPPSGDLPTAPHFCCCPQMNRQIAGTNGHLNLRCCAFPLSGQVSTEWSRWPGSMAWCASNGVAPLQRSSADWMPQG